MQNHLDGHPNFFGTANSQIDRISGGPSLGRPGYAERFRVTRHVYVPVNVDSNGRCEVVHCASPGFLEQPFTGRSYFSNTMADIPGVGPKAVGVTGHVNVPAGVNSYASSKIVLGPPHSPLVH